MDLIEINSSEMNQSLPLYHTNHHRKHEIPNSIILELETPSKQLYPRNDIFSTDNQEINDTSKLANESSELQCSLNVEETNEHCENDNETKIQGMKINIQLSIEVNTYIVLLY